MAVKAWEPSWQQRFRSLIQRWGYDDAFAFAMSRTGESFGEMFGSLRRAAAPEDAKFIALRHLEELFYVDANNKGKLREAVMEALVRSLRQHLRYGWNRGKRVRERRIGARTRWPIPSFVSHADWNYDDWKRFQERAWREIESIGPSDDWCPMDHNDPLIQEVFSRFWPTTGELGKT